VSDVLAGVLTREADWSALPVHSGRGIDDAIYGSLAQGIARVPANGGTVETVVSAAGGEEFGSPHLLPDGETILFSVRAAGAGWDTADVTAYSMASGVRTVVWRGGSDVRYVPTGHLVFARGDTLFGVRFDLDRLSVVGEAVPLVRGVMRAGVTDSANYGISSDGSLAYVAGTAPLGGRGNMNPGVRTLVWVSPDGREQPVSLEPRVYQQPRVSPDGTQFAVFFAELNRPERHLGVGRGPSGARPRHDRITAPGQPSLLWTPDSQRLAFRTHPPERHLGDLLDAAADGTGEPERLVSIEGDGMGVPRGVDRRWPLAGVHLRHARGSSVIGILSMEGERTWRPLIDRVGRRVGCSRCLRTNAGSPTSRTTPAATRC
jgi:hypothetical protein